MVVTISLLPSGLQNAERQMSITDSSLIVRKKFMQNHCIMMAGMNEGQKEKHNTEKKIGLGPMLGISDAKPSVRLASRPVSQWRKDVGY